MADLLAWPEGLPLPLRDGYGFTPYNNILRTEMDSGRARQRLDFEDGPTIGTLRFLFSSAEAALFEAWQSRIVKAAWFTMTLVTPLGFGVHEVRFTEKPDGGQLQGRYAWGYSCSVELRFQPLLEPGWAEILPDYILLADIFDYAMNREWPLAKTFTLLTESGSILTTEDGLGLSTE